MNHAPLYAVFIVGVLLGIAVMPFVPMMLHPFPLKTSRSNMAAPIAKIGVSTVSTERVRYGYSIFICADGVLRALCHETGSVSRAKAKAK